MKHVRTVRSYEALTVPHGDKSYAVTSEPTEVSDETAKAIQAAATEYGVEVEVSDSEFDVVRTATVGGSVAPDLSRGVGSINGYGQPVPTFANPNGDTDGDADHQGDAPGGDAQGDDKQTTTSSASSTTTKGK